MKDAEITSKQSIHDAGLPKLIGEQSTYINSNPADYALVGKSTNCRRTYISRLNQVARLFHFGSYLEVPWHLLRHEHVHHVVKILRARNIAPATINTTLSTLRAVAREAFYLGQLSGEDFTRILHIKLQQNSILTVGRHISVREIAALVRVCEGENDPAGIRDIAILGLLYVCGLRRAELVKLNVGDFNQRANTIKCCGRSENERTCWPDSGTKEALLDWLATRSTHPLSDETPLFTPIRKGGKIIARAMTDQSIYTMINKRSKQAGLKPCTPYDFRRSFVTNMLDSNIDVLTAQRLAGHANPATTMRYDRRNSHLTKPVGETIRLPYSGRGQATLADDN